MVGVGRSAVKLHSHVPTKHACRLPLCSLPKPKRGKKGFGGLSILFFYRRSGGLGRPKLGRGERFRRNIVSPTRTTWPTCKSDGTRSEGIRLSAVFFIFFIFVFYKNIFSFSKFTEIYPGHLAAGRQGLF